MSITREDVLRIARLAHLELSDDEVKAMVHDLDAILAYADRLDSWDPEESKKIPQPGTPMREDRVDPWLQPGEATGPAPSATNHLFRVPPAIEERD